MNANASTRAEFDRLLLLLPWPFDPMDHKHWTWTKAAMKAERQDEADKIMAIAIADVMSIHKIPSYQKAVRVVRKSLGYLAVSYGHEVACRVHRLFECQHPVFGKKSPDPSECYKLGMRYAHLLQRLSPPKP